jgi:hypothetical protein
MYNVIEFLWIYDISYQRINQFLEELSTMQSITHEFTGNMACQLVFILF